MFTYSITVQRHTNALLMHCSLFKVCVCVRDVFKVDSKKSKMEDLTSV